MLWSCKGKVKKITFICSSEFKEYKCCINGYIYVYEKGWGNIGLWDWLRKEYTIEPAEWAEI